MKMMISSGLRGLRGLLGLGLLASAVTAWAQKPAELKIGMTTFLSGPAAVFGVPGKAAAEILIDDINAQGGIGGVKVSATYIDEIGRAHV